VDYSRELVLLAVITEGEREKVIGLCQYGIDENTHTAEAGVVVRDQYQDQGVGTELMSYLILQAKKRGLLGLTAEVLAENAPMLKILQKLGFEIEKASGEGMYKLVLRFGKE
jgi:RimJ/RimL family protein N-acetyltransferase